MSLPSNFPVLQTSSITPPAVGAGAETKASSSDLQAYFDFAFKKLKEPISINNRNPLRDCFEKLIELKIMSAPSSADKHLFREILNLLETRADIDDIDHIYKFFIKPFIINILTKEGEEISLPQNEKFLINALISNSPELSSQVMQQANLDHDFLQENMEFLENFVAQHPNMSQQMGLNLEEFKIKHFSRLLVAHYGVDSSRDGYDLSLLLKYVTTFAENSTVPSLPTISLKEGFLHTHPETARNIGLRISDLLTHIVNENLELNDFLNYTNFIFATLNAFTGVANEVPKLFPHILDFINKGVSFQIDFENPQCARICYLNTFLGHYELLDDEKLKKIVEITRKKIQEGAKPEDQLVSTARLLSITAPGKRINFALKLQSFFSDYNPNETEKQMLFNEVLKIASEQSDCTEVIGLMELFLDNFYINLETSNTTKASILESHLLQEYIIFFLQRDNTGIFYTPVLERIIIEMDLLQSPSELELYRTNNFITYLCTNLYNQIKKNIPTIALIKSICCVEKWCKKVPELKATNEKKSKSNKIEIQKSSALKTPPKPSKISSKTKISQPTAKGTPVVSSATIEDSINAAKAEKVARQKELKEKRKLERQERTTQQVVVSADASSSASPEVFLTGRLKSLNHADLLNEYEHVSKEDAKVYIREIRTRILTLKGEDKLPFFSHCVKVGLRINLLGNLVRVNSLIALFGSEFLDLKSQLAINAIHLAINTGKLNKLELAKKTLELMQSSNVYDDLEKDLNEALRAFTERPRSDSFSKKSQDDSSKAKRNNFAQTGRRNTLSSIEASSSAGTPKEIKPPVILITDKEKARDIRFANPAENEGSSKSYRSLIKKLNKLNKLDQLTIIYKGQPVKFTYLGKTTGDHQHWGYLGVPKLQGVTIPLSLHTKALGKVILDQIKESKRQALEKYPPQS